jgi:hypothetical protein
LASGGLGTTGVKLVDYDKILEQIFNKNNFLG